MKATKKQINILTQDINTWLESLSNKEFNKLVNLYKQNPKKTRWNILFRGVPKVNDSWLVETKNWKDSHIDTMLRRALKGTILF